jgi:hypothetical protein
VVREQGGTRGNPTARLIDYRGARAFGVRWKAGKRHGEVSAQTFDREEAIEFKAILLHELRQGRIPGRETLGPALTWAEFRRRYEDEALATMSRGSRCLWRTAANHCEQILRPKLLIDLDKSAFSALRSGLMQLELSDFSVATYLRTLRAALGWAEELDLIDAAPKVRARKGLRISTGMRGRPVNDEEFERIVMMTPKERPRDAADWEFFLHGLRTSSLRVDELNRLSWDPWEHLSIVLNEGIPYIRMLAEGHKSRRDVFLPVKPEFWKLIDRRGVSRSGRVFPLKGRGGRQMSTSRVIHVIGDIGKRAGVIVDPRTNKTATSHCIGRKAFFTELSKTMSMSETQQMARHSDPRTTSQFYILHEAKKLAHRLGW